MKNAVRSIGPVVAALLLGIGCNKQGGSGSVPTTKETVESSVAGITWSYPTRWVKQGPRAMRAATYTVAGSGSEQSGECAVFFFGSGQGGDVGMNIDRWAGQFQDAKSSDRTTKTVSGLKITMVTIEGTYLSPSGPMMQSAGAIPGYKLLGAIVEAPQGMVFYKLTAPASVANAAAAEFQAMLDSVTRI